MGILSKFANLVITAKEKITEIYNNPDIGQSPTLLKTRDILQAFGETVSTVSGFVNALSKPGNSIRTTLESPAIISMLSSIDGTDREKFDDVASIPYNDIFMLQTSQYRHKLDTIESLSIKTPELDENSLRVQDFCHRIRHAKFQMGRIHPRMEVAPSGYFYSLTQTPWLLSGSISCDGENVSAFGLIYPDIPIAIASEQWVKVEIRKDIRLKQHVYAWTLRVRPSIEQAPTGKALVVLPDGATAEVNYSSVRAVFRNKAGTLIYKNICIAESGSTNGPRFVLNDMDLPADATELLHFEVKSIDAGPITVGFSFQLIGIPTGHKCLITDVTYYGVEHDEEKLHSLRANTTWGDLYLLEIGSQEFNDPNFGLLSVYSQTMVDVGKVIFSCVLIARRVCDKYHQLDMVGLHRRANWADNSLDLELYDPNEWLTTSSTIFDSIENIEAFYNVLINILDGVMVLMNVSDRAQAEVMRYEFGILL